MRSQSVISLADFRFVSIECPHCHTKVVLDMQTPSDFARKHGRFAPFKCPGCDAPYDTAVQPNVDALQEAYSRLFAIADRISFIGEPEEGAGRSK